MRESVLTFVSGELFGITMLYYDPIYGYGKYMAMWTRA